MAGNSQKRGVNGDSPHAGKTVFSALGDVGHTPLAEEEEQKPLQSGALAVLEGKTLLCMMTYYMTKYSLKFVTCLLFTYREESFYLRSNQKWL